MIMIRFWCGAVVAIATVLSAGCGSDGNNNGNSSAGAVTACRELCVVQGKGANCPATATDSCNRLCDMLMPAMAAQCPDSWQVCLPCMKNMSWQCMAGGDIAMSPDQTCNTQCAAWNACISGDAGAT
jgi:hypothetical protein